MADADMADAELAEAGDTPIWRRASRCESHSCVEVAFSTERVRVRSSRDPRGGVLTFDPIEWRDFCAAVAAGEFTPPAR